MSGPGVDTEAPPAVAAIDPRIRARRIAVRRDQGRRRLRRLLVVLGTTAVASAAWGLTRSPLLDVDRVAVSGATRPLADEVAAATGVAPGEPMVDVDPARVADLVEALPWVDEAQVARTWPGTLEVQVRERAPVAVVPGAGGTWALVDGDGRVLAPVAAPSPGLVQVTGLPAAGEPGAALPREGRRVLEVLADLPAVLADQVRAVRVGDDGLELDLGAPATAERPDPPRTVVRFGPPAQVAAKALAVLAVLERVGADEAAVLDVRVPSAPALTRRVTGA